jgi:hypothetical protein
MNIMPAACCRIDIFQSPMLKGSDELSAETIRVKMQSRYSCRSGLQGGDCTQFLNIALAVRNVLSQGELRKEKKLKEARVKLNLG